MSKNKIQRSKLVDESSLKKQGERKNIKKRIQNEQNQLTNLLNTIEDGVFICNKKNEIEYINPVLKKQFGPVKGQKCYEYFHGFSEPCSGCIKEKVLSGKTIRREWYFPRTNRTYDILETPIKNYKGEISKLKIMRDITKYKKIEGVLRESERKHKGLIETSFDGYVMTDMQGKILDCNEAFLDMLGYTMEEIVKLSHKDLTPPKWYKMEDEIVKSQFMQRGYSDEYDKEYIRKNGTVFPISIRGRLIKDEQNKPIGMWGFVRDITKRKQVDEVLLMEYKRLLSLLDNMPFMVCLLTPDYHVTFANRSFRERFGESHGRHCYEYCFGKKKPCAFCETYKVLRTGKPHRWEVTGPNGATIIDVYDFPFTDVDGSPMILEVDIDITNRRKMEEQLRKSEEQMKKSQEIAHLGSWELEIVKNHLSWSDEVYRIFGLKPEEFGATYEAFLAAVHPDDRAAVDNAYHGSIREGKDTYEIEHRVVKKNGEIRFVYEKCEHIRDDSGKIIRSIGMVQDITPRKEIEKSIQELNQDLMHQANELAASNKELESFSYSVSHDLRAPLRSIDGFSQALLEDYADKLDEEGKDYLNRVRKATQQMSIIIDNLLKLSHVNRSPFEHEKLNLTDLSQLVIDDLKKKESDRKVKISIDNDLTVIGDKHLLRIALENLIGNAWKFTCKKSNAKIEVGKTRKNGKDVFFVRDNGAGFDMKYADKLFVPFQRLHSEEEFEGIGIGLGIVNRIIHRHGGEIWAEGKEGEGATFYFSLGGWNKG